MTEEENAKFTQVLNDFENLILSRTARVARINSKLRPHLEDMRQHTRMFIWKNRDKCPKETGGKMSVELWFTMTVTYGIGTFIHRLQPGNIIKIPQRKSRDPERPRIKIDSFDEKEELEIGVKIKDIELKDAEIDAKEILETLKTDEQNFLMEIVTHSNPTEIGKRLGVDKNCINNRRLRLIAKLQKEYVE